MIDLRSDTVTMPTMEMISSINLSKLGDDVYQEDYATNELQEKVADYFGKEAALFVPSGTMANQIALAINTNSGDEVICESNSHIYFYETAAPAILSRVQLRVIDSKYGEMPIDEIEASIREDIYYLPNTTLICLESTHNRHGGTIINQQYLEELGKIKQKNNLKIHLDGARLWNALIAHELDPKAYTKNVDTINVCFSKGLGAPIGSAIIGSKEEIKKALKIRKILGGGMRQSGVIASMCLYAFENNLNKMKDDNHNAKHFANLIIDNGVKLDLSRVQTNIVLFEVDKLIAKELCEECKKNGLIISHFGANLYRVVMHSQMKTEIIEKAADILVSSISKLRK